ncbi:enoyl-CoA hydratase/isomerase family protein [Ralstonia soli]|uniref:3-hydroxyisobutyryl-CoA hydrolase n=1 Tax=Ralstonia soli TaxID=2953896 RepID=A0ABT1AEC6_9RALS|nr:enoyl-CoA hydratase/isomerase family protein [Ralstonia soli]MCO5396728.1 enoyl-CoA hydratase/isomerase family protein [Ralstonia soli]
MEVNSEVTLGVLDTSSSVSFRVVNRVAIITLCRPKALNALSHDMILVLGAILRRCRDDGEIVAVVLHGAGEKAFCAGGDVRSLYDKATNKDRSWVQFFADEYQLDFAVHKFPKPVIALLDGITMGGGMGLSQGAWLRVVTERSKLAMPETRIGLVPDVGASYFLARMPVQVALYLALTGVALNGPDAVFSGLADVCVSSEWLSTFEERLVAMPRFLLDPAFPDVLLHSLRTVFSPNNQPHEDCALGTLLPAINAHFRPSKSVVDIVQSLAESAEVEDDPARKDWLINTRDALTKNSPLMVSVAKESVLRGREATLGECFRRELDVVVRCVDEGDFAEGVRALLLDRDHRPSWRPATLAEVKSDQVRHFLSSPWREQDHPLRSIECKHP